MSVVELSPLGRVYCLILSWGDEPIEEKTDAGVELSRPTPAPATDQLTEANRPVDSNLLVDQSQTEDDER